METHAEGLSIHAVFRIAEGSENAARFGYSWAAMVRLFPPCFHVLRSFCAFGDGMKSLGPWFPFFADDFISGTAHMTAAEIGAYVLLLCHQWRNGDLPSNPSLLTRICRQRIDRIVAVLDKFEPCGEGKIRNKRMYVIREERMAYKHEQSRKGELSAISRGSTAAGFRFEPKVNLPSASASASPKEEKKKEKRAVRQFAKPTKEEVAAYAASVEFKELDAETFIAYYESKGWLVGTSPMKSWQAAVITWKKRREKERGDVVDKFAGAL